MCKRDELPRARRTANAAARAILPFLFLLIGFAWRPAAAEDAVKGEISAAVENGFARLVFRFADDVESQARLANNILTITFQRPVDVRVDRISMSMPDYIAAARRDPDGKAVRFALNRKVTMNSTPVGERLFVDLLPDGWTGLAPGLPREVIDELARRAREAEKKIREQRELARQSKMSLIPVRVVVQPTFTRYIFDLPELIGVSADNAKDNLTLTFDSVLRFDLADAKATLPPAVEAIDSELANESVKVRFRFSGKVDVRTFREDNSYIVDVTPAQAKRARADDSVPSDELAVVAARLSARTGNAPPVVEPPKTVPARPAPPPAPATNAAETTPAPQPPAQSEPDAESERKRAAAQPAAPTQAPAPPAPPSTPLPTRESAPMVEKAAPAAPSLEPAAKETARPAATPLAAPAPVAQPAPAPERGAAAPSGDGAATVKVAVKRDGENLTLRFPFASPTPAAVFRRADTLWLVFDTQAAISIAAIEAEIGRGFKAVQMTRPRNISVLRIKLERPKLINVAADGSNWSVTLGNDVLETTQPLALRRNLFGPQRSSVTVLIDDPHDLHRLDDPDAGDTLLVVTALGPARGFVKSQDFVEFRVLAASQGVVIVPLADDVAAELSTDKIIITRPTGLTLSAAAANDRVSTFRRQMLDTQSWGFDQQAEFNERNSQLISAAAEAPEMRRPLARADLARFYLARDMAAEAKAVLDVAIADDPPTQEDSTPLVLRAIANIQLGRVDAALKDLANPLVGNQHDAPLWRALAYARAGRWQEARAGFRGAEAAIGTMPLELQRTLMKEMVRAFIEVGDITGAVAEMHEIETVGIPHELEPSMAVLSGRIAEGLGRPDDARRAYQVAADSWDRPAAAQGRLREIVLRRSLGTLKRDEAIAELETLTAIWRGDDTEIEALHLLGRLYTEENRYRDAFHVMRTALQVNPNSEMTRRIQDEAAATFDGLFLAGKGDALPAIDALALFYDFRELTPIGRRGDEMIRQLADRLVSVDLLSQASELLQYQVDHRLQGAARAQVAARLAVVYLMNRKPDRALATLRATRVNNLSNELRNQRLLLEARALSDTGRHEVALEVAANLPGKEAIRLRSDILWAAKRWSEAAEQIELLYGDRWRDFAPLADNERTDILRAAIGYALGEDSIGLMRFREKYAGKMGDGADHRAFDVVTSPVLATGTEFREIARSIAAVDTLDAFLSDLRVRYPGTGARPATRAQPASPPANAPAADPPTTGTARPGRPPHVPPARTASAR